MGTWSVVHTSQCGTLSRPVLLMSCSATSAVSERGKKLSPLPRHVPLRAQMTLAACLEDILASHPRYFLHKPVASFLVFKSPHSEYSRYFGRAMQIRAAIAPLLDQLAAWGHPAIRQACRGAASSPGGAPWYKTVTVQEAEGEVPLVHTRHHAD
jgi:hypothetical protein